MTTQEYILKLQKRFDKIQSGSALALAVNTTVSAYTERIFSKGLNSANSNIGHYDTRRSLYINPNLSPRAGAEKPKGIEGLNPPTGKTGKTVFASGKKKGQKHKTTFVNNYKDFRNRIGRRVDIVNLNLSGQLKSDIENGVRRVSDTKYELVVSRDIDRKKIEGNDDRFGMIFKLTTGEKKLFFDTLIYELNKTND